MYYGNSIQERCRKILDPLIDVESSRVTKENIDLVNTIIVSCLKQLLEQKCADPEQDADDLNKLLINIICYITGVE